MANYLFIFIVALLAIIGEPMYAIVVGVVGVLALIPQRIRARPQQARGGTHKTDK